jgi:dihydrofolate reductase
MAELIADLFVSVDGFARGEGSGPFFDYGGPDLDRWIDDQFARPHVILMGRVTYEVLAEISSLATDEGSIRMTRHPKAVFSNTLREPLAWANSRLISGGLAPEIARLKEESADPIRSIGSMTLVKSLLRLGLVDRLRLMVFPLTLGSAGREPAYADLPRTGLDLVGTTVLDNRLVLLEYRPVGSVSV